MKKLLKAKRKKDIRAVTQKRKQESNKDLNENVGELFPKNGSFKETADQGNIDFQLFNVSVDTSKEKSGKEKSIPANKDYNSNKNSTFEEENINIKNKQKGKSTPAELRKDTETNSIICFTMPKESNRKVRIIAKNTQSKRHGSKGILRDISPKTEKRHKRVSFADIDVYGSTPENSSSESSESFPYKKYYQRVYQAKIDDSPDSPFRKQGQIIVDDKNGENTVQPQAKELQDKQKLGISPNVTLKTGNLTNLKNEKLKYPISDLGLMDLSSQHTKEIATSHEETKVDSSYNNETTTLPMTKNADTYKRVRPKLSSEVERLDLKSKISNQSESEESIQSGSSYLGMDGMYDTSTYLHKSPKDTKYNQKNIYGNSLSLADSAGRKPPFDTNEKSKTSEGGKTNISHSSKSPLLVSSIPKPSPYLNRTPVKAASKDRNASTSGVKRSSVLSKSRKGSRIKTLSGIDVPTKKDFQQKKSGETEPGESLKRSNGNGSVKSNNKPSVEILNFLYSHGKEEENPVIIQNTSPSTNTIQGSLELESIQNISTQSTFYSDPEKKGFESLSNKNIQPVTGNTYANNTNVLAFPGRVDYKTPFQDGLSRKNSFDEELEYEIEDGYKLEDNNISRSLVEPSVIISDSDKERLSIRKKNKDYKNIASNVLTLEEELNLPASNEETLIEPSPPDLKIRKIPNTFQVLYAAEEKDGNETNAFNLEKFDELDNSKMKKPSITETQSLGDGPKGLIIFVNRNTLVDKDEFDDTYEYSFREDVPLSKQGLYGQKPSKSEDSREKRYPTREFRDDETLDPHKSSGDSQYTRRSTLSKIIPYISSKWDGVKQSLRSSSKERDSGLKSGDFDKKRGPYGSLSDQRHKEPTLYDDKYSKKSSPIYAGEPFKTSFPSSEKGITVERSPSGRKITQKYPCGCLRIITIDSDSELETEEFMSAFCKAGSLCEIQHPELQRTKRTIGVPGDPSFSKKISVPSTKHPSFGKKISVSTSRCWLPDIEIVADGMISKKKIPERPPAPTMRGAKLAGSINIKSNRLDGVCNLYFDPRLLRYLIYHIDEVQTAVNEYRQD